MFKEPLERGIGENIPDIETLRKEIDESPSKELKREKVTILIKTLENRLASNKNDVSLKIDLAEAQTVKRELERDMDLDFTKPEAIEGMEVTDYSSLEEKIEEEKQKIAAARRGIELARSLNDEERVKQLESHIIKFHQTIELLQPEITEFNANSERKEEKKAINDSDFDGNALDNALRGTREEAAADRLDARRRAA